MNDLNEERLKESDYSNISNWDNNKSVNETRFLALCRSSTVAAVARVPRGARISCTTVGAARHLVPGLVAGAPEAWGGCGT